MIPVKIGHNSVNVPQTWNELTAAQLPEIMLVFNNEFDTDIRTLELFKILTDFTYQHLKFIGAENLVDIFYFTDFLMGKNTLTKNIIPHYAGRYGPADNFDNLLISEFIFTESHFVNYKYSEISNEEKKINLNKLIAVLYRSGKKGYDKKRNKDGDIRQPFNDNLIPYEEKQIRKWPLKMKLSVFHWYEGCRSNLVEDFPEVFSGSSPDNEASKYGLWDLIYSIADKGIFGEFAKVEGQFLKTILMALTKIMAESEKLKKPVPNG